MARGLLYSPSVISSRYSTTTLPWLAAMLIGGAAHVGWLAHVLSEQPDETREVVCITERAAPAVHEPIQHHGTKRRGAATRTTRPSHKRAARSVRDSPTARSEQPIESGSERVRTIPRETLETFLAHPKHLAKQGRLVPSLGIDGAQVGFKIYGIRRDSLPKLLGFKNGDMLTAVNGLPLTSVQTTMAAYPEFRKSDITVEFVRKGVALRRQIRVE